MKRIPNSFLLFCFTISFIFCAGNSFSQSVWNENFNTNPCTTGCNLKDGYTGNNGAWTVQSVTTEGADANAWYISCAENGNAVGSCGTPCNGVGGDNTLHIANVSTSVAAEFFCPDGDCGANYDTGAGDGTLATDKRAISPVINLTGKSNLVLSFQYIEQGQGASDNLTVDFSSDGGATWTPLADPPKSSNSGCPQDDNGLDKGKWTAITPIPLPGSADNNPNVKIAFHWKNNDDGAGADPSAAIDNIVISQSNITPGVHADFSVSNNKICQGDCVTFTDLSTATGTTITSWVWTFTGGIVQGTSSNIYIGQNPPPVCYSTNGTFNVKLAVKDATINSNSKTETGFISINPNNCSKNAVPDFTPRNINLCTDSTVVFHDASTGSPNSWTWSFQGGTPSFASGAGPHSIKYSTEGDFTVTLTVSNDLTPPTSLTDTVHVKKCEPPIAGFKISLNNFCPGTCIAFIDTSLNDPITYKWKFFGGAQTDSSTEKNPTNICYDTAGVYKVTLRVTNTKGSDMDSSFITVADTCVTLKLPSAFSPNGDKKNDLFGIPEKVMQAGIIKTAHGSIYNRWGQLVFEMQSPIDKWNGKLKNTGAEQPVGVYVYYIEASMKDGTTVKLNGNVTLLR